MNQKLESTADLVRTEGQGPQKWTTGTLSYTTAGLVVLFAWLLWGDFAWSMRERSIWSVTLLLFKKFEASDTLTGILTVTIPCILGLLVCPVISYLSDRHRGRLGRRIPFLLVSTPLVVISLVGLAFSPSAGTWIHDHLGSHSLGLNFTVLVIMGLSWTMFEFACVITNCIFGGLVNDVVPQSVMGRFYGLFRIFSLCAGIVFNYWLLAKSESHFVVILLGIAAFYGIGFTLMCAKVKEGQYPPVTEPANLPGTNGSFGRAVKSYVLSCFGNRFYLWYFAMVAASALSCGPVNTYSVYYAKSLGMSMALFGKCLAITYAISIILAYPIGALVDRFHPLRVCTVTLSLYAACVFWSGFYARDIATFQVAIIVHGVISGIYFTASASLAQRLLPRERFTELGSACGIIMTMITMSVTPLLGYILDLSGHLYHYTFFAAALITTLAVVLCLVVDRKFVALGGPKNYVAPE
jgi:MFS family permease